MKTTKILASYKSDKNLISKTYIKNTYNSKTSNPIKCFWKKKRKHGGSHPNPGNDSTQAKQMLCILIFEGDARCVETHASFLRIRFTLLSLVILNLHWKCSCWFLIFEELHTVFHSGLTSLLTVHKFFFSLHLC